MIDSSYLLIPSELELISSNLLYSSPLDSSPSTSFNQLGLNDYYSDYENQNNLNNLNLGDFSSYNDMTFNPVNCNVNTTGNLNSLNTSDHYFNNLYDDGYNLTNLTNQLVDNPPAQQILSTSTSSLVTSSSSPDQVNHRYSSASSDYLSNNRPLSTTSNESDEINRSIDGCKRDLIKATLNFAIKSRRRSRGLGEIEFKSVKSQNVRPSSWTDEDDEKKMSRRERNRIAARKCRKNRKAKFIGLNKSMENLDNVNNNLREQLIKLERESGQLEDLLTSHQSQCFLISWSSQPMLSSASSSISSPSLSSSSPSPNHMLINDRNSNYSQSDESHGFISYINQSQIWPNALQ